MREMNAWLQRHDLSSEEFEITDAVAAKELLRRFDWASERELEAHSKDDTCPAGLGLVAAEGHVLHICPGRDGHSLVHYHFPKKPNLLGLRSHGLLTWTEVLSEEAERMIDHFFSGDFDVIRDKA